MDKDLLKRRLPPLFPSLPDGGSSRSVPPRKRKRNYAPVSWEKYFERKEIVEFDGNRFCVYCSGSGDPALVFLHGGGYSAMTWAIVSSLLMQKCHCQVVAIDSRGHGSTETTDNKDLSAASQARDIGAIVEALWKDSSPPSIVLVGHSMGGAIAVHAAARKLIPSIVGLVVIDVVEGSAMEALSSMQSFLKGRPKSFRSQEQAIEWSVRAGQTRSAESACVSVPTQLRRISDEEKLSTSESTASTSSVDTIQEEQEEKRGSVVENEKKEEVKEKSLLENTARPAPAYTWRIDLSKTQPHWEGWFKGLSKLFLSCSVAKLLLLAGVDRLDKDLTIGQMQGKFEMHVLPQCGHAVHEDSPDKVSQLLATFLVRNKFAHPKEEFSMYH
ncbi:protein phosphatase methylesterase 1-like [Oscarella lobularis]|uniref:protein phosphatase methylesterase 1-like n=1 Tax=Oscarella lobularis TaxID=121494 RepID=UPI0033142C1F